MARGGRAVVQAERLSDQVYELLREDLKSGQFSPGQRLLEVELAEMYKVSRTPVREALFQLSREGLLAGNDRGYVTPVYTKVDIMDRLEVKRLLDPRMGELVAENATAAQISAFGKALDRAKTAHASGKVKAFNNASRDMRTAYYSMCQNELLIRCVRLADDQFETARWRIHESAENRALTIEHESRLLAAIAAHDPKATSAVMTAFIEFLAVYYNERPLAEFG